MPKSPALVRNTQSSMKPNTLTCSFNAPLSLKFLIILDSLSMVDNLHLRIMEFQRVILPLEFAGVEQNSQELGIIPGRPSCADQQADKNQESREQASNEI